MSFLTTNPSPFILNQPELTNVVTSATGGSSALCNAITDILSIIDTANASFSANSLSAFNRNSITVTTTLNLSNSAIYINGSNTLSSNVLNGNPYMAIQTLGLEKARFTVNGFGINTTTPRADLDINGVTAMRGNLFISTVSLADPVGSIYFDGFETLTYNNLNGNSTFMFSLNGSNSMMLTSSGLGVLTANPKAPLDVNGSAIIRGDLYVSTGGHLYVENGIELTASTVNGAPYLAFETTGVERARITSVGTGFNTSNPQAVVDVDGESIFRSNLYLSTAGTLTIDNTNVLSASTLNGFPYLSFEVNGTEKMRLISNSLGIETTDPKASLDVNGASIFRENVYVSSFGNLYIDEHPILSASTMNGNPYISFEVNGNEIARISTNSLFLSNVAQFTPTGITSLVPFGIGTANPEAPLDIVGNSVFRSSIQIIDGNLQMNGSDVLSQSTLRNVHDFEMNANVLIHLTNNAVGALAPIGIYTSTPQAALDVHGDIVCHGVLKASTLFTPNLFEVQANTSSVMTVTQSNLHISVSSLMNGLEIQGNLFMSTSGVVYGDALDAKETLSLKTNTIDRMIFSSIGIGIGTSNPLATFDIRGDTLIGGSLYVSSLGAAITSSLGYIYADGDIFARSMFSMSDSNLKRNVTEYRPRALPTPVEFQWKSTGERDIGVIAQEMEYIEPACVKMTPAGTRAVDYSKLVVLCLAEIRALRQELLELRSKKNNI
jgi:hypothetical protein